MTARILVVDDIPANVKLLEARLLAEYFDVLTAADGYEALAICEQQPVDLILLDIMMPGMDGFEVCERLKANPRTAHIPVVMVTALDQPSDRVRGLKAGADDFLTKPVNDLQLMSRVKSLVRLKNVSDELRLRAETAHNVGLEDLARQPTGRDEAGNVLLVDGRGSSQERIVTCAEAGRRRRRRCPIRRRRFSRRPRTASISSSSMPISTTTIRCGSARSSARWSARAIIPILLDRRAGA